MNKLIYANFSRLWKSKIFWIGLILTDLLAVWILADRIHFKMISGYQLSSDDMIFSGTVTLPFVAAVVISIFIGTEYSDGTIRNKLITGHSRHSIYFANLITSTAAVFIIYTSYLLIIVCAGIPLVGNFAAPIKILLANFIINFVALASLSAILLLMYVNTKQSDCRGFFPYTCSYYILFHNDFCTNFGSPGILRRLHMAGRGERHDRAR